jgi:rod shape-determining protein MreC
MDGVFPKGVPIGKIEEITRKEVSIFQEVTVTPFVDFERLEEVLIVPLQESVDPL